MHHVYVFNHNNKRLPHKIVKTCAEEKEAILTGCKLIHTLASEYKEELYTFMEMKELTFDGILYNGVHIYNGNIAWSVFATNCSIKEKIVGPIGYDKANDIDFGSD